MQNDTLFQLGRERTSRNNDINEFINYDDCLLKKKERVWKLGLLKVIKCKTNIARQCEFKPGGLNQHIGTTKVNDFF